MRFRLCCWVLAEGRALATPWKLTTGRASLLIPSTLQAAPRALAGTRSGHWAVGHLRTRASACLLLRGLCSNTLSQLQHLFYKSPVLSDTIWNDICHPLSGVIYLLAPQRNIWCALISGVQANIHGVQLRGSSH